MNSDKIQQLRQELANLIEHQVKPLRQQLDKLLNKQAEELCPFSVGEVITLDNGKKGQITDIKYYSLGINYSEQANEYEFMINQKIDEIEYLYAYQSNEDEFTITWEAEGKYMIKNNTVAGKVRFSGISPATHIIDTTEKSVKAKTLNQLVADSNYLSSFESLL